MYACLLLLYCYVCVLILDIEDLHIGGAHRRRPLPPPRALAQRLVAGILRRNKMHTLVAQSLIH
jgi:hypothetical protein